MEKLLSYLKLQLEEQSVTLRQLKHENESLRKLVEQIQLDVNQIKETHPLENSNIKRSSLMTVSSSERDTSTCSTTKEPPGEYVPKKIRSMTFEDEQEWLRARFHNFKLQHETSKIDGTNSTEDSIPKFFLNLQSRASRSYGIKLTNYSKSTLLRPSYFVPPDGGDKCRLPSCIDVGKSKAICFQGRGETCSFLLSFDIGTTSLCLIIYGVVFDWNRLAGSNYCQLGIGISASDLPMVESLYDTWRLNSFLPYDWVKSIRSQTPVEIFSSQGNHLVRGHVTPGIRHSVVNVEILEYNSQFRMPSIFCPVKTTSSNCIVTLDYLQRLSNLAGTPDGVTCLMELGNGLDVPIKLRGCMSCERSRMLTEVPPLGLEMFCLTGKMSIEATFAYEIESTDLGLLIAVKAGENENKFAAVFHPVSEIMFDADLDKLLNPDMWGYLLNQKFTHAKGGEQIIQTRNIRANVTMTEGQKSQVKIRLYAV